MYVPENLKRWTYPDSYIGPTFENYYVFLGRNRESSILENCNFDVAIERLKKIAEESENTFQIVRASHFLVGWIEWIAVHESAEDVLKLADKIQEELNDYPSLDDDMLTTLEDEEADRIWKDCYKIPERIKYIRKYRNQFDFSDYSDMIKVVRGEYFIGYASELIY